MIKIENTEVYGFEAAIRGMRNPMNSWDKSDSNWYEKLEFCRVPIKTCKEIGGYCIGDNDWKLMKQLAKAGSVHAKYRRMITVTCDITAPMFWWAEYDTYKVGTVRNSCSKMHKIHSVELLNEDFSCEGCKEVGSWATLCFVTVQNTCNKLREKYNETKEKKYWRALIELLPESYNQRATVQLNYEVLAGIYRWRKDHKLDEWHTFCKWVESLPYSEIITGGNENGEN
jgi:hypothetical protein